MLTNRDGTTAMTQNEKRTATPRLRFPEFRNDPPWPETPLNVVLFEHGEKNDGKSEVHSVSVHKGVVNQVQHLGRSFAAADRSNYNLAKPHDIIYTKSPTGDFPYGIVKQNQLPYNVIVSPLYGVFSPINRHLGYLLDAYFESPFRTNAYLAPIIQKGAKNTIQISNARFLSKGLYLPQSEAEHKRIAECLSTLDELIEAESRKLDALKDHKTGLMQQLFPREGETRPRLRFPEFQDAPGWESKTVDDLVDTITPPKKLLTSDYRPAGQFPVIDQSQDYICGWTDDEEAVIDDDLPVVVFGDHTCALKFVDRPFAQGADGIKILKAKADVRDDFLFYSLQANPVQQESYKRHFSTLRERVVAFPDKDSGEQRRIAACVSSLDDLIAAQSERLEALRAHKRGLMQQLFPNPSEFES
jgi:type I restriction enzyme S subunit